MTADEIKVLGDSEMETGRSVAIALGIVSIAFLVILGGFSLAVIPNLLPVVFFLVVSFGSAAVTGAVFWAYRRRNAIIKLFTDYAFPAPTSTPTPALPEAKKEKAAETDTSRGGDSTRKLFGIPTITLEWVCNYLGNKNSWAEAHMEKMPVPYVYPPTRFGKAEGNTIYNQLFHPERGVVCRAGIIGERGGDGNSKGKLLVDNPVEMMERLKKLEQEDTTP